jgi:hypothetical protein
MSWYADVSIHPNVEDLVNRLIQILELDLFGVPRCLC